MRVYCLISRTYCCTFNKPRPKWNYRPESSAEIRII